MMMWTTRDAFLREVGSLLDGKQQFLDAQEEMAESAQDEDLVRYLRQHLGQTEQQIVDLERIIQQLSEQDIAVTNHAARGLSRDVQSVIDDARTHALRDWLIATLGDAIEHAEIAHLRGLVAAALELQLPVQVVSLLQQGLAQDRQACQDLEILAPGLLRVSVQQEGE